ncbi:ligand-binding sensor domain-containing diguanylate cyclase [uncultured Paraglaciecola sp.]|uniref:ligand-binding sensor domain-containing diguanylate cyclase n=1 Tax=uncultured Paraglaciecola sp. TaxID=1765024 RepID=UPI0026238F81|nr:ligand-binding sensor domain-containing diguanylate cyclase [uncultured Paraglaciecola sp.]
MTKTIRHLGLTLLVIYLSIPSVFASGPSIRFENLSIENGLPQSSAKTILQDHQGFLWVGTEEGLARYDGYEFKVFKKMRVSSQSLSNNHINVIYEDRQGDIWVGTRGGGLNRFNPATEQFTQYLHQASNPNSLSHDFIHTITQDKLGYIWVGTDGGGLNRLDPDSEKFTHYLHNATDPNSLSGDAISTMTEDTKGNLWIGTWAGGLNRFNSITETFTRYQHQAADPNSLSNNAVTAIIEDKHGNLWLGTKGGGLNYFNLTSDTFTHYRHDRDDLNSLSDDEIAAIIEDKQGNLWVGTDGGGLNYFDLSTQQFTHYRHQTANLNSLSNDVVLAIIYDQQGNLWVGTNGGGLNRLTALTKQFSHYHHQNKAPFSLSNNIVRAITQDRQGTLWVGTWGGGLNRFNSDTKQFTHYRNDKADPNSINDDKIYVITEDRQGILWIGADSSGLNRFNSITESFTHYSHDPTNPNSLSDNAVSAITEDHQGDLWLGTWKGLNRFDPITEQFTHYRHQPTNPNRLSNDSVRVITQGQQGELWIGTWKGLNRFDPITEKFTHFTHQASDPNSLSNDTIYAITEDSKGNLWVGTASGLNLLDKTTGSFNHFFEKDGLANNVVYRIEEDNDGGIWLSTNLGLSHFNPQTKSFKNYNMDDGLQSNEFNADASFKSESGELFFGGINGFNRFFPKQIIGNEQQPKVIFTDMLISNQSVPVQNDALSSGNMTEVDKNISTDTYTLAKAIHSTAAITLTHQQNLVSFEFSALHFSNSKNNQYAYRMEGFDDEWIKTDYKSRRATYTNLPTGDYVLRVIASNPYGIWNERGAALNITVLPPPWLSWWAYSLYCLFLLVIVGLFVWSQHKKVLFIQQVNEALEIKVAERTLGLQEANEKLEKINITDELTGLKNRRFIVNNLKNDVELVLRKHRTNKSNPSKPENNESDLIFFLIDLDRFKQVNDLYGHTAGDAVLTQVKSILTQVFRETDYLVRWGGEEFLVVARYTDRKNAAKLAEKLRYAVEEHDFAIGEGNSIRKTCSIGYASFPFSVNSPNSLDWEHVLDIADHCLYAAKKSARNSWVGLVDIDCKPENMFVTITKQTAKLIQQQQLKVESSLAKSDDIKWH